MTDYLGFDPDGDEVVDRVDIPHDEAITVRSSARRITLQALYEIDTTNHAVGDVLNYHLTNDLKERIRRYTQELVQGIEANRRGIDAVLQTYASEFPLVQVAVVDRNILRIALYEMALTDNIPIGVAIDEAMELAKLYGADNTPRFINGVLGNIADNIKGVRNILKAQNKSQ